MRSVKIYLNDRFVDLSLRNLAALAPGRLKARGAFETVLILKKKAVFMKEHLQRLRRGLRAMRVGNPFSEQKLNGIIAALLKMNHLENARLRIMVWESNGRACSAVICQGIHRPNFQEGKHGLRVIFSRVKKRTTKYSRFKTLDYEDCFLAFKSAQKVQADEAVMFNRLGHVAEGSRSNLFFVLNNCLFTPSLSCGCLDGVVRRKVLQIAKAKKIPVQSHVLTKEVFYQAQEVFLTNSIMGIKSVRDIGGRVLGNGKIGPVTQMVQREYRKLLSK